MYIEKYIDDIYTCNRSRCGFCREECPIYSEFRFEAYSCRGRMQIARGVLEKKVILSKELSECLNLCTACGYCQYQCALNNVDIIESLRADLVKKGITNKYHNIARKNVLKNNNPMNLPKNKRAIWSEGLEFDNDSSILFFAGCVYSYTYPERLKKIIKILNHCGIKVKYLGEKENCCGNILYTTGYREDFNNIMKENLKVFKNNNIKTIITPCPGCAKMLVKLYSEHFDANNKIKIIHIVEYFDNLIKEGKLVFKKPINLKITWHDPCDLARHLRIIDEPRRILNSIPGLELIEMEHNRFNSKCCGAGGGMLNANTDTTMDIAEKRLKEAEKTKAEYIITSCPTCESTFERIIRYEGSEIKILSILDLIFKAL